MADALSSISALKTVTPFGIDNQKITQYGIESLKYVLLINALYHTYRMSTTQTVLSLAGWSALRYCQEGIYHKAADERLVMVSNVLETTDKQLEKQRALADDQARALAETREQLETQKGLVREHTENLDKLKDLQGLSSEEIEERKKLVKEQREQLTELGNKILQQEQLNRKQEIAYQALLESVKTQELALKELRDQFKLEISGTATTFKASAQESSAAMREMTRSLSDLQTQLLSPQASPYPQQSRIPTEGFNVPPLDLDAKTRD